MNTSIAAPIANRFRQAIAKYGQSDRNTADTYGQSDERLPSPSKSLATTLGTTALVLGVLISSGLILLNMLSRSAARTQHKQVDKVRDKTLKDSFPASDPPASQFFDIPVNRQ